MVSSSDSDTQIDQGSEEDLGIVAFRATIMGVPSNAWKHPPLPPQLTPPLMSLETLASPPPLPAWSSQASLEEAATAAPTREPSLEEVEECWLRSPREEASALAAAFSALASNHSHGSSSGLLEVADSFSDLSSWCEGSRAYPEDAARVVRLAPALGSAENLPRPEGLPSRGSAQHEMGKCKPCAFVHRPAGCVEGATCRFCHLCGAGEKKQRQKQKFEAMRLRRQKKEEASLLAGHSGMASS